MTKAGVAGLEPAQAFLSSSLELAVLPIKLYPYSIADGVGFEPTKMSGSKPDALDHFANRLFCSAGETRTLTFRRTLGLKPSASTISPQRYTEILRCSTTIKHL